MKTRWVLAALLVLALGTLDAQTPKIPIFQAASRLVLVNVIVRGKPGAATNLTQRDFTISDQGKPRSIGVFSLHAAATAPAAAGAKPLSPDTFSNLPQFGATPPRSITIVLLDNLNTLYGSTAEPNNSKPRWMEDLALANDRNHLAQYLQHLQPQDRVAIYGLRHQLHILCDFTCSRSQLLALVKGYDTGSVTSRTMVEPDALWDRALPAIDKPSDAARMRLAGAANENRSAETLAALRAVAAHVANVPGRKNLVWLTSDLTVSPKAMARILTPADIAVYPIDGRGLLAARVPVSVMSGSEDEDNVSGAAGFNTPSAAPLPPGLVQMDELAERTGGRAFVNTNNLTGAIRSAVEDSQITCTLGFYVNASDLDGKFHMLKVKIDRKGLRLRYARSYLAYESQSPSQGRDQAGIVSALRSPLASSAIPVFARVQRANQPAPGTLRITGDVDLHNVRLVQQGAVRTGSVSIAVFLQNQAGQVLQHSENTIHMRWTASAYGRELQSGLMFRQTVQPASGATMLRIVVQDPATSLVGTVIIPLVDVK
ncbi:MAG: VWA domain-containing protein [Terriglobales bacterium]